MDGSNRPSKQKLYEGDGLVKEEEEFHDGGEASLLDIYKTRQSYGYCAIFFSIVQTIVLGLMMWQCGMAPLRLNPMVGPYPEALNHWGAKNAVLILHQDEYWRLLTPTLLHAGVLHLVGNVHVQLETGVFYEREWGSLVWLFVYISGSIGSMICSTCFMPNTLSVGSSGAVMAIFGAKISEIGLRWYESQDTDQGRVGHAIRKHQLWEALGGSIIVMLFSFIPFVDWAAHLGGLISGIAVGMLVFPFYMESWLLRCIWFLAGLVLNVVLLVTSVTYMLTSVEPNDLLEDVCGYYQSFFADYECSCDGG